MKKIIITVTFVLIAVTATFGQQKVAIYVTGGETEGIDKTLRYELMSALHKHKDKYILVERQIDYTDIVKNELCYQMSGHVDDNDIVCVGKQFGAELVCIGEVSKLLGDIKIIARFVDVTTVEIKDIKSARVPSKMIDPQNIEKICKEVAENLIAGESKGDTYVLQKERASKKPPKTTCITKGGCFGLDVGVSKGFRLYLQSSNYSISEANNKIIFAVAPRYTYYFSPYFGLDFKINGNFGLNSYYDHRIAGTIIKEGEGYFYTVQLLPGIRGNTPTFYKCMSGYAAFRLGYGIGNANFNYIYYLSNGDWETERRTHLLNGFCMEAELGVNITKKIFTGFAYTLECHKRNEAFDIVSIFALRVGFNFGKK